MKPTKAPRLRRIFLGLAGIGGGALLTASVAWACTEQAYISISPNSGPAGTEVTVVGRQFQDGPVAIYWNSAGGPKLGEAPGPNFTTAVRIPDDPEKFGYVYAVGYNEDGSVAGASRTAFTITSSSPGGAKPDNPSRPGRGSSRNKTTASARSEARRPAAGAALDRAAERAARAGGAEASSSSPSVGAAVMADSTKVFAGSLAPGRKPAARSVPAARRTGDPARFGPPEATASGDLWSGLGAAQSPSLAPSLAPEITASRGSTPRLAVALALLGAGIVALLAGALVAGRRRSASALVRGE